MAQYEWQIMSNVFGGVKVWQVWRQTRPLEPGEPMNGGAREHVGVFATKEVAQAYADSLNGQVD